MKVYYYIKDARHACGVREIEEDIDDDYDPTCKISDDDELKKALLMRLPPWTRDRCIEINVNGICVMID